MRKLFQILSNSDPWLVVLVLGTLGTALLCSRYAGERTEVGPDKTVVSMVRGGVKRDRQETKQLVEAFEALRPDIHLQVIKSNVPRKQETMIAAGTAPDLVRVDCDKVNFYTEAGALLDLLPYIEQDPELRRDFGSILFEDGDEPDFITAMVEPFIQVDADGTKHLYAIPVNYTPFIIYYNKDLFDRYNVPYPDENWDWEGLRQRALALTRDEEGRRPDQEGFDKSRVVSYGFNFGTWQHVVEAFIRQAGGRLVSADGERVVADEPATIEALQFLYDLKYEDNVVRTATGAHAHNLGFEKGTVGMLMWGIFRIPSLNEQVPELDWDIVNLPRGPRGTRAGVVFANGWGISAQCENPEEAFAFLRFLASREGMRLAEQPVFLPTRRSVLEYRQQTSRWPRPESRWALTHDVDNEYAYPPSATKQDYSQVYTVVNETFEDLLYNPVPRITPREAGETITYLGNRQLARDRRVGGSTTFGFVALGLAVLPLAYVAYRFVTRPRKKLTKLALTEERWGYALISPWVIGFTIFAAFPILVSIMLSFSHWQSLSQFTSVEFVGLRNYQVALTGADTKFWQSLWVTFRYALLAVPLGLFAGLTLAILMNQPVKGITVFRTLYYIPAVLPSVAAAILWWHLFSQHTGWVNIMLRPLNQVTLLQLAAVIVLVVVTVLMARLLRPRSISAAGWKGAYVVPALGCGLLAAWGWWVAMAPQQAWVAQVGTDGWLAAVAHEGWLQGFVQWVGSEYPVRWLWDENFTPYVFVVMALWSVGGGMIIYLAGLQGIPTQLYEAAEIDGASRWQKLRNVTIPMLSPVIFFNLIMGVIASFQVFNVAYVLFDGGTGPNDSALFYGLHLFREAFMKYRLGYASALAWILFIIILAFTALIFKSSPMWVYYESSRGKKA